MKGKYLLVDAPLKFDITQHILDELYSKMVSSTPALDHYNEYMTSIQATAAEVIYKQIHKSEMYK